MAAEKVSKLVEERNRLRASSEAAFFDRDKQMEQLLSILVRKPTKPIVVVGPNDTGKSALLLHLCKVWIKFGPIFLVDLRSSDFLTPDAFAHELRNSFLTWTDALASAALGNLEAQIQEGNNWIGRLSFGVKAVANPANFFSDMKQEMGKASSLAKVLSFFKKFVVDNPHTCPIIIIDEAHALRTWQGQYENQLIVLLEFLSWLTKQKQAAHVVLTSSDDSFRDWLHLKRKLLYRIFGLGNFGEADAKAFFMESCLDAEQRSSFVESGDWDALFKHTGGSPSLLLTAAELGLEMDWLTVLEHLREQAVSALLARLTVLSPEYSRAEVGMVLDELVARNGVIPVDVMIDKLAQAEADNHSAASSTPPELDKHKARLKLRGMVKENLFHLRYCVKGMWYEDLKRPEDCMSWEFILPFRPVELEAARHIREARLF